MKEEQFDTIVSLLTDISMKLDDIRNEVGNVQSETSYTSNVRDSVDEIGKILNQKLK